VRYLSILMVFFSMMCSGVAFAQNAAGVVRIVVPFAAGGAREALARTFYTELGNELGKVVIVESRPGAGGAIGTTNVARSAPDGNTLIMAASSHFVTTLLSSKPTYDPVKDFVAVANVGVQSYVLMISSELRVNNLKDFVALVKTKPGAYNYGSAGVGSSTHLAMAYLVSRAGIEMTHIPYKSTQEAANDVAAGRVQAVIVPNAGISPYLQDARLKIVGVTAAKRTKMLPNIPTIAEAGVPGYAFESWFGLLAPAKTPEAEVNKINAAMAKVLKSEVVSKRLDTQGVDPEILTPAEFKKIFLADQALMANVVKSAGMKPE
jgi:tripartite-type tricarboxylate transporter receptor subunit TctC